MWILSPNDHYSNVIISVIASQITDVSMVCSNVCPGADQRKHQDSASLVFVRRIHRWPVNSPHKWPVTWKMFPFDDVIMTVPNNSIIPVWCWAISWIDDDLLIWPIGTRSGNVLILINNIRWTTLEKMQNTILLPSQGIHVILNFAWDTQ